MRQQIRHKHDDNESDTEKTTSRRRTKITTERSVAKLCVLWADGISILGY